MDVGGDIANGSRSEGEPSESAVSVASIEPVPCGRFTNRRELTTALLSFSLSFSFSFFLKMLENIFLKFPEEVGKRPFSALFSKVDNRGEGFGENVLVVVNDERGNAEKMEETELEDECPCPELDRGECGSERASEGGLPRAKLPPNATGEEMGRGMVPCPDGDRRRTGVGDTYGNVSAMIQGQGCYH